MEETLPLSTSCLLLSSQNKTQPFPPAAAKVNVPASMDQQKLKLLIFSELAEKVSWQKSPGFLNQGRWSAVFRWKLGWPLDRHLLKGGFPEGLCSPC